MEREEISVISLPPMYISYVFVPPVDGPACIVPELLSIIVLLIRPLTYISVFIIASDSTIKFDCILVFPDTVKVLKIFAFAFTTKFDKNVFPVTTNVPPIFAFPDTFALAFTTKFDKNVFPVTFNVDCILIFPTTSKFDCILTLPVTFKFAFKFVVPVTPKLPFNVESRITFKFAFTATILSCTFPI